MKHFLLKYFSLLIKKCFLVSIPVQEKTKKSQPKQPRKQIQAVFQHRFASIFSQLLETKCQFSADAGVKIFGCIEDVLCSSRAGCPLSSYIPQSSDANTLPEISAYLLPTFKSVSTTWDEKGGCNGTQVKINLRVFISDLPFFKFH